MEHKNVIESLASLRGRVNDIEQEILQLKRNATPPVATALERTREGTSLLRGLLWSAHMAVDADQAPGRKGSLP
jgi:hypothetical protein